LLYSQNLHYTKKCSEIPFIKHTLVLGTEEKILSAGSEKLIRSHIPDAKGRAKLSILRQASDALDCDNVQKVVYLSCSDDQSQEAPTQGSAAE
jgi:hypothetical protein